MNRYWVQMYSEQWARPRAVLVNATNLSNAKAMAAAENPGWEVVACGLQKEGVSEPPGPRP
jgi:hypothetical protein